MSRQLAKSLIILTVVFLLSGCAEQTSTELKSLKTLKSPGSINKTSVVQTPMPVRRSVPVVEYDESSDYEPQTFDVNDCIGDCSGHEAGYNWAEEKGIDDPSDCGGNSSSFIEGCESYAEEQQESVDDYE